MSTDQNDALTQRYDVVADCVEGRCSHTTNVECARSWERLDVADGEPATAPFGAAVTDASLPTPASIARIRAQALADFLEAHQWPQEWVMGTTEDGAPVTVDALLRQAVLNERAVG